MSCLVEGSRFLRTRSCIRVPRCRQRRVTGGVLDFCTHLPRKVSEPFAGSFLKTISETRLVTILREARRARRLLRGVSTTLTTLPLSFRTCKAGCRRGARLLSRLRRCTRKACAVFPAPRTRPSFTRPSKRRVAVFSFLSAGTITRPAMMSVSSIRRVRRRRIATGRSVPRDRRRRGTILRPRGFHVRSGSLNTNKPGSGCGTGVRTVRLLRALRGRRHLTAPRRRGVLSHCIN